MPQDPNDPPFTSLVQEKDNACELKNSITDIFSSSNASYRGNAYYAYEVMRDVLLDGIIDIDIRRSQNS